MNLRQTTLLATAIAALVAGNPNNPMTDAGIEEKFRALTGEVLELEASSGRRLRTWFAGRFIRQVSFARDGASLWVASNLGMVLIRLDETP